MMNMQMNQCSTSQGVRHITHTVNHVFSRLLVVSNHVPHRRCVLNRGSINPLTTEFFPPRQHIFMHSAHTTFVGTPLPQHSLLSGQTWWGPHTWRDPSGNTVNDIHDPPQAQQSEVKGGCQPDFRPAFP